LDPGTVAIRLDVETEELNVNETSDTEDGTI
jgi:hypothetical protein